MILPDFPILRVRLFKQRHNQIKLILLELSLEFNKVDLNIQKLRNMPYI